jgi:hypothetical protein
LDSELQEGRREYNDCGVCVVGDRDSSDCFRPQELSGTFDFVLRVITTANFLR